MNVETRFFLCSTLQSIALSFILWSTRGVFGFGISIAEIVVAGDGKCEKTKYTTANYKQLEQQAKEKKSSPGSTEKQKYTTANYKQLEANAKQEKKNQEEEKQRKSPSEGKEKIKSEKPKYTTANYKQLDAIAKEKKMQHSAIVETNEKIIKNLEKTGSSLRKSIEKTGSMLLMRKSKSSTAFGSTSDIKEDEQNLPTLV